MRPDSPWKTLDDVIAAARASDKGVTFATAGVGTPQHLTISQLGQQTQAVVDALAAGFTDATRWSILVATAFLLLGLIGAFQLRRASR